MDKRTFLKLSSVLTAGTVLSPMISWQQKEKLMNWAGNIEYSTDKLYFPGSVEQVQQLVKKYDKLKVLGTRHCFNRIADSTDQMISLKNLDQVISLDPHALTVTVGSGIKYGQLGPYLHDKGFALHNLASLPHISVAGACMTGTHGSGVKNGNLSTAVVAIEMVTADGSLVQLSKDKDGENFLAAVVGLGALGVITKVTLRVQPTYMVRQDVYENLSFDQLKNNFDKILSSGYSVSLFTDWQNQNCSEVWIKSRVEEGTSFGLKDNFFGAKAATKNLHPIVTLSAENCTEQMGVPGPWYDRLPHFRMGFTPSSGKELQAEYFVSYHHGMEAILTVSRLAKQIGPQLMITEIRTIAADNLWMSPCYQQPSMTIHFTLKQNWPEVSKLLIEIEKELEPFNPKPHWGKLFMMSPKKLQSRYEKLPAFQQVIKQYDPKGKFRNKFLDTNIYG
jgi:xylitol oxidase